MNAFKRSLQITLVLAAIFAALTALYWFHFHVWRVSHPGAPTWTYFFTH